MLKTNIAKLSLRGNREENQDRVSVALSNDKLLMVVVDGLGGHSHGALAAEVALSAVVDLFCKSPELAREPQNFLERSVQVAHQAVTRLGAGLPVELMPRATLVFCLVETNLAHWAHVGDSRLYHLRDGKTVTRTRDHSHVEILVQDGIISEDSAATHPMRSFVESCLGGDPEIPIVDVAVDQKLEKGDVLLLCSDGLWSPLQPAVVASALFEPGESLPIHLRRLCEQSVAAASPNSDNTTAAAMRLL